MPSWNLCLYRAVVADIVMDRYNFFHCDPILSRCLAGSFEDEHTYLADITTLLSYLINCCNGRQYRYFFHGAFFLTSRATDDDNNDAQFLSGRCPANDPCLPFTSARRRHRCNFNIHHHHRAQIRQEDCLHRLLPIPPGAGRRRRTTVRAAHTNVLRPTSSWIIIITTS